MKELNKLQEQQLEQLIKNADKEILSQVELKNIDSQLSNLIKNLDSKQNTSHFPRILS